jgi:hypothetical protein
MGYDQKAVAAFNGVKNVAVSMQLPLMLQRRYNGILNAIEVQVEDGRPSKEVIAHLREALLALARFDKVGHHERALKEAFDKFEAKIASRMA